MRTVRDVAARCRAISSMDVYRAWGVLHGSNPDLEPLPLREDSPLRTTPPVYPSETVQMMAKRIFVANDRYDKVAVGGAIRQAILRYRGLFYGCPWCTGPELLH